MNETNPDAEAVAKLLGRNPSGEFEVVLRCDDGTPRVIKNHPVLRNGTPMPTLYWLTGAEDRKAVSRLESSGGIAQAESEIDGAAIERAHDLYSRQRDSLLPEVYDGPRPSGGVGGTRKGIKCLHAHYAWYLVGGEDPVGKWVSDRISGE